MALHVLLRLEKIPYFKEEMKKKKINCYIHGNSIAAIKKGARVSWLDSCVVTAG